MQCKSYHHVSGLVQFPHCQPNEGWNKSLFLHLSAASLFVQGLDPDAPDEDEENEVEDAEGDQEETELL